jgi:hypothetical protein
MTRACSHRHQRMTGPRPRAPARQPPGWRTWAWSRYSPSKNPAPLLTDPPMATHLQHARGTVGVRHRCDVVQADVRKVRANAQRPPRGKLLEQVRQRLQPGAVFIVLADEFCGQRARAESHLSGVEVQLLAELKHRQLASGSDVHAVPQPAVGHADDAARDADV